MMIGWCLKFLVCYSLKQEEAEKGSYAGGISSKKRVQFTFKLSRTLSWFILRKGGIREYWFAGTLALNGDKERMQTPFETLATVVNILARVLSARVISPMHFKGLKKGKDFGLIFYLWVLS